MFHLGHHSYKIFYNNTSNLYIKKGFPRTLFSKFNQVHFKDNVIVKI